MTNKEKAKLLLSRHLSIVISWGGVPGMFENCSDVSQEGLEEFFEIMDSPTKSTADKLLTDLIGDEYERQ